MALSYNLGYQESISVHPTRLQNFAGKPYSNFPNIWEWLICWAIYENIVSTFFWESPQVLVGYQSWGLETIEERQQLLLTCLEGVIRLMMIYWWYDENSSCLSLQQGSKRWHQQIECKWPFEASQYGDSLTKNNATAMTTGWKIKSC